MNLKVLYASIALLAFMSGCTKDPDQSGCTDPTAVNYEPRALREDGSCEYDQSAQLIWSNGSFGGWNGNLLQGAFYQQVCRGYSEVITVVTDTLFALPADTLGADTTLIPEIEGFITESYLLLGAGSNGRHKSHFSVVNERNGSSFGNGSLRFNCRKAPQGAPATVEVFICGKLTDADGCEQFMRSDYLTISTHSLTDTTFTEVSIAMRDFERITMGRVNVLAGFGFEAADSLGIIIDNLRWTGDQELNP